MNKKKYIILTIVSVLSFILITIGVTYSFFSYIGQGSTENTVKSGTINFIYEEVNKNGNGISITDALPVSDSEGKASNNYFDFKVTSSTGTTIAIPYEITARVSEGSDDLSDYVKLYLTKVNGNSEQQVALSIYSDLNDSTNILASQFNDKTLYTDEIPVGASNYTENYRLRMWLNNDSNDGSVLDYSPVYQCSNTTYTNQTDCESNNGVWNPTEQYTNQNKTFSIKINVYANGEQASQQKIESATTTDISGLKINNTAATENTDPTLNYDYYVETSMDDANNIELLTLNNGQTYTVENITEQEANTLKGVSATQNVNLVSGINYLKVTVTSANRQNSRVYVVKVNVVVSSDATLHSLNIENCPLNETFNSTTTSYSCTTSQSSLNPTYTIHSKASAVVSGTSNLKNGSNTILINVTAEDNTTKLYRIVVTANLPVAGSYLSQIEPVTLSGFAKKIYDSQVTAGTLISTQATLTSDSSSDASGLYVSTDTNSGQPTYYFRGDVNNNYVSFAGNKWRVVRINEDGTVRITLDESQPKGFYSGYSGLISDWYQSVFGVNAQYEAYASYLARGNYYCKETKFEHSTAWPGFVNGVNGGFTTDYVANFRCRTTSQIDSDIGLITYDEAVHAGGYPGTVNTSYYLNSNVPKFIQADESFTNKTSFVVADGRITLNDGSYYATITVNIIPDVTVTGTGTSLDPWVIQ